jgi:hypothetical protein
MIIPTTLALPKLTARRSDPNYTQVTSHVPKELAKRLKFYCTEYETTITEAVEEALREYLDKKESDRT